MTPARPVLRGRMSSGPHAGGGHPPGAADARGAQRKWLGIMVALATLFRSLPRLCAHRYKYVRKKLPHCGVAGSVGEGAYNPHETLPYLCVAFCVTAPDRDQVTNVIKAFLLRPTSPFVRAWRPHTAARWLRRARLPAASSRARGLCLTNAGFFCTSTSSGSSAGLGVSLQRQP